jgi:hypothetical protein
MLRLALLLALALRTTAAADDDRLLETPRREGIPERLRALEREWAQDVGIKDDPAEDTADDAHEPATDAGGTGEPPSEAEPVPTAEPERPATPASRPGPLEDVRVREGGRSGRPPDATSPED